MIFNVRDCWKHKLLVSLIFDWQRCRHHFYLNLHHILYYGVLLFEYERKLIELENFLQLFHEKSAALPINALIDDMN